jgi:hypothetical protein
LFLVDRHAFGGRCNLATTRHNFTAIEKCEDSRSRDRRRLAENGNQLRKTWKQAAMQAFMLSVAQRVRPGLLLEVEVIADKAG